MHLNRVIINMHNYIKKNIYDDVQKDYHDIKLCLNKSDSRDDYQIGYDQALLDFRKKHRFRHYPSNAIKPIETFQFITGYYDGEIFIIGKMTR